MTRADRPTRVGHADPRDVNRLTADLAAVGVRAGQDLLVHCSMRRIGPVVGGPATLLAALRRVAGPDATVVVPAHTVGNSTTGPAFRAATSGLNAAGRAAYEAGLTGFDPATTPSEGMGILAEYVRQQPDAARSGHPITSFAALGRRAVEFTEIHDLDCHLGERSPLGNLFTAGAAVLLLGVGYARCTALHLAEYRPEARRPAGPPPERMYRCYVLVGGRRERRDFRAPLLDASDFPEIGAAMEACLPVGRGLVGAAPSRLLDLRVAVDFATTWMAGHRRP
ncbi:aminoglycoside N(3)-acetyltransferase [Micromonospora cremea]|uniref:Aminoglycoside N(3)-acetyltransferase n=1 Tax=Micromonospora cremea TaxID=709881 RepID=A0A1N5TRJ6_9ACTN|nr:AAC(3) family N-acetyltransferase [Micromonospora cremea]SIM50971.1 aminoglycoside 3-N-acetyltransferase [Micromonospora cremea]